MSLNVRPRPTSIHAVKLHQDMHDNTATLILRFSIIEETNLFVSLSANTENTSLVAIFNDVILMHQFGLKLWKSIVIPGMI